MFWLALSGCAHKHTCTTRIHTSCIADSNTTPAEVKNTHSTICAHRTQHFGWYQINNKRAKHNIIRTTRQVCWTLDAAKFLSLSLRANVNVKYHMFIFFSVLSVFEEWALTHTYRRPPCASYITKSLWIGTYWGSRTLPTNHNNEFYSIRFAECLNVVWLFAGWKLIDIATDGKRTRCGSETAETRDRDQRD